MAFWNWYRERKKTGPKKRICFSLSLGYNRKTWKSALTSFTQETYKIIAGFFSTDFFKKYNHQYCAKMSPECFFVLNPWCAETKGQLCPSWVLRRAHTIDRHAMPSAHPFVSTKIEWVTWLLCIIWSRRNNILFHLTYMLLTYESFNMSMDNLHYAIRSFVRSIRVHFG